MLKTFLLFLLRELIPDGEGGGGHEDPATDDDDDDVILLQNS